MKAFLVVRAYMSEILLVAAIYSALFIFVGPYRIAQFVDSVSGVLSALPVALIGAGLAFVIAYHQYSDTDFGHFLHTKNAHSTYVYSLVYPMFIYIATTVILLIAVFTKQQGLLNFALACLLYSVVLLLTTVTNVVGVMKIRNEFRSEMMRLGATVSQPAQSKPTS